MIQKKICMVGAFGVGKTSLVTRFVQSIFSEKYLTTVGVKIDKKQMVVDGEEVTLMLWDLAGKDAVTQIKPEHLRGASGYILVVDGTRADTLRAAIEQQARCEEVTSGAPFTVVVNKADIKQQWELGEADFNALQPWTLVFSSAKTGEGVEQLFLDLATRILRKGDGKSAPAPAR